MINRYKTTGEMIPHKHGAYVLHADYKALEEKAEKLNWTFNALDKIEGYLEAKGLVNDYKEWRNANSKKIR